MVKGVIIPASVDSDLEAFSDNPTDDSFVSIGFSANHIIKCLNK